jgi:hypothetical protein
MNISIKILKTTYEGERGYIVHMCQFNKETTANIFLTKAVNREDKRSRR